MIDLHGSSGGRPKGPHTEVLWSPESGLQMLQLEACTHLCSIAHLRTKREHTAHLIDGVEYWLSMC